MRVRAPRLFFAAGISAGLSSSINKVFHEPSERIASSFKITSGGRLALPRTEPRPFCIPPPPLAITHDPPSGNDTFTAARGDSVESLDEFGLAVATPPADGSTRFVCAFVDNTRAVSGDVEAQIWVVRSKYGRPGDDGVGGFESACIGLKEGEVVLDLAFYSAGKLAVLLADEAGRITDGVIGCGTPEEEEGVQSSLIMLSYVDGQLSTRPSCRLVKVFSPFCSRDKRQRACADAALWHGCRYEDLNFAPLPPEVNMPGVAPPWLTGFSDFNATALDDALEKRRNVATMHRHSSSGGRGGRAVAMGGARGLGCVITGACGFVLLDMEDEEEEDDEYDDDEELQEGRVVGRGSGQAATRAMQLEEDDVCLRPHLLSSNP